MSLGGRQWNGWGGVAIATLVLTAACSAVGQPQATAEPESDPDAVTTAPATTATDAIAMPPVQQQVSSFNQRYEFVVEAADGWSSSQATGRLRQRTTDGDTQLWQQPLPQQYGPLYMIVGGQGEVLLLDEFIHVASPYAVMVLNRQGEVVAQHSFDEVQARLNVSRADLVEQAKSGWWISEAPQLDEAAGKVTVAAGGKTLIIDLTTGQLSL